MSSCGQRIQRLLKACDLFPTTQYLRYRGEPEYETATGGCTSLLIIGIFLGLFASMGLQTARRQLISSTMSVSYEQDPSPLRTKTDPESGLMFAFHIMGLNLNDPAVTYFDLTLTQAFYSPNFTPINSTVVPLEPCTAERFSMLDNHEKQSADFQVEKWKCPPADFEFSAGGKLTSDYFSLFTLRVERCNPNITSNCIPDASLTALQSAMGEFRIVTPLITTIINPDDQTYHSVFVDDRNAYSFGSSFGFRAKVWLEESHVDTDVSLMPYEDFVSEKFKTISEYFQTMAMSTAKGRLVEINFQKSSLRKTYTRNFNKIDNYFSYVGGIIGTILGFIFIMHAYSERAYGVSMASQLYLDDDGRPICSGGFNFFYLLSLFIWKGFQMIGCTLPNWKRTEFYSQCIDEIDEQLDVALLMKKVNFCEKALYLLFRPHQLQAMHLQEKETLAEASKQRKKYQVEDKIKKGKDNSMQTLQGKGDSHVQLAHEGLSQSHSQVMNLQSSSVVNPVVPIEAFQDEVSVTQVGNSGKSARQRMKSNLIKVIGEAESGNEVSAQLASGINSSLFPQLGLGENDGSLNIRAHQQKTRHKRVHRKREVSRVEEEKEEYSRGNSSDLKDIADMKLSQESNQ